MSAGGQEQLLGQLEKEVNLVVRSKYLPLPRIELIPSSSNILADCSPLPLATMAKLLRRLSYLNSSKFYEHLTDASRKL